MDPVQNRKQVRAEQNRRNGYVEADVSHIDPNVPRTIRTPRIVPGVPSFAPFRKESVTPFVFHRIRIGTPTSISRRWHTCTTFGSAAIGNSFVITTTRVDLAMFENKKRRRRSGERVTRPENGRQHKQ